MTHTEDPNRALRMARRALAILEEQAAGYTALSLPVHLRIELEDKRREVAELEARLGHPATGSALSTAAFDQRGQQVHTQINVAGDYHAPPASVIHITGDGNVVGDGNAVQVQKGAAGSAPVSSTPDLPSLRARLQLLDDVELDGLCLDHFPTVYGKFGRGLRRDEKLNLLLDHCRRQPEAASRLARVLE